MEKIVYQKSRNFVETGHSFCPGCGHGIAHNIVMDTLDELGITDKTVIVYPVGCAANALTYCRTNMVHAPHGRAPAVATGLKRCAPDQFVVVYQGDGDLAAIGMAETIHMANRGEKVTTIFINNTIYGMTGGQMAPTTLVGMKSTTTPKGRDPKNQGYPMHMCEILNTLDAPAYIARVTCTDVPNVRKAKAAIKKAFEYQMAGKGFSFVEIVSNCTTNWGGSPLDTIDFIKEKMLPEFPLGEFRAK